MSYKHTGNATILKYKSHTVAVILRNKKTSVEPDLQNLNMLSGFVKAACSGFPGKQFDDTREQKAHVCDIKPELSKYRNAIQSFLFFLKNQIHQFDIPSSKCTCYNIT